jgi:hypothetical protein
MAKAYLAQALFTYRLLSNVVASILVSQLQSCMLTASPVVFGRTSSLRFLTVATRDAAGVLGKTRTVYSTLFYGSCFRTLLLGLHRRKESISSDWCTSILTWFSNYQLLSTWGPHLYCTICKLLKWGSDTQWWHYTTLIRYDWGSNLLTKIATVTRQHNKKDRSSLSRR